jgi:hypothetical protein
MPKNAHAITLEIPMYAVMGFYTQAREFNPPEGIKYVLYAGWPGSALNGGRVNGMFDGHNGVKQCTGLYANPAQEPLPAMKSHFLECIEKANRKGHAVYLTYSNFFALSETFNSENALPLERLAESGERHGIRNGVVLANDEIKAWVKSKVGSSLDYVCSCTKFYASNLKLGRDERIESYKKVLEEFDYVVIAPPDSSIEEQLDAIPDEKREKIIAVVDSPCSESCNSFWHYAGTSVLNILLAIEKSHVDYERFDDFLGEMALLKVSECDSVHDDHLLQRRTEMLLSKGYSYFKLGRSSAQAQLMVRIGAVVSHLACR